MEDITSSYVKTETQYFEEREESRNITPQRNKIKLQWLTQRKGDLQFA